MKQGSIRILKTGIESLMARTRAIPEVWPWVLNYLADVNNHCASRILRWKTPIEVRYGYTPDISAFCLNSFWEKDTLKSMNQHLMCRKGKDIG